MTSGQSLIIASPQSGKIFKYCFSGYKRVNVMELLLRGNRAGPRRSVFPTESLRVDGEHLFFTYSLYEPPWKPHQARAHAKNL